MNLIICELHLLLRFFLPCFRHVVKGCCNRTGRHRSQLRRRYGHCCWILYVLQRWPVYQRRRLLPRAAPRNRSRNSSCYICVHERNNILCCRTPIDRRTSEKQICVNLKIRHPVYFCTVLVTLCTVLVIPKFLERYQEI